MNDKPDEILNKITDDTHKQSAQSLFDWLAANKINLSGKFKDKRWGMVSAANDGGWFVHINVQYDEFLDEFLSGEPDEIKIMVKTQAGHMGCPRCKTGKCQFTGTDIANPDESQIEFIKKLILYRINAIKEGRLPKCSYVKSSRRGETLEPCAVHKVCDPKCRAMKNP
ncbi:MAG: hypothetical protein FWF44_00880 [Defluviitaleaceae bacterium]|nr:hypothetical protein [Defluviitaleaceae bacterium]